MDETNNVYLRWNKHQANLVSAFDSLLDNEKLTDCTISAEGHHLRAHKIVLSACSRYFEELFTENYEKHPIIILHDVKYDIVKALVDFMYRGEVNVPQEQLSCFLKLSESLQVRGLSGSGCVDDVNTQNDSGRNASPLPPDTLPSQSASVSSLTSGQNEPEENMQSFRGCSPTVSSQEGGSVEVESISKSIQKYRKDVNHSGSDQETGQNASEEVITPDLDSVHQLPSQRQVLPTTRNSTGGPVYSRIPLLKSLLIGSLPTTCSSSYSAIPHQSVCSELQSSSGEVAVTKNEQFLMSEAVLPEKSSANMSTHQQEVSIETKSEVLESHMEIVEDLTLDDEDDYSGDPNYRDDCNSAEVDIEEVRRVSEGLTDRVSFYSQGINSLQSPFDSVHLSNMTLTSSQAVLRSRFICDTCGKSYHNSYGLWRHKKYYCGKEPQFQCPHCSFRCSRSDNLKTHMATRRCQMHKKYALFEGGV